VLKFPGYDDPHEVKMCKTKKFKPSDQDIPKLCVFCVEAVAWVFTGILFITFVKDLLYEIINFAFADHGEE